MSLADPFVQLTDHGDGSAKLTVSVDDEDHRFSIIVVDDWARMVYEESLSWRGEIRTKVPEDDVWKLGMQSDEVTEFLESHDVTTIKRDRP